MITLEKMRVGYEFDLEFESGLTGKFLIVPTKEMSYESIKHHIISCGYAIYTNEMRLYDCDNGIVYFDFNSHLDAFRYFMKNKYGCEVIKIGN